jgi:DNA-directed RNA polymerase subunit alpha|tara:strand:- start:1274 stop:2203 length:930 start_codon:yes stop_codon:yes gene_type:complete
MLQIQCLQSKTQEINTLFSRFVIGPLKKGQGLTIGNALRRVLLSDLQGLAIAGVRMAEVNHEFSTIPDVKEDVIDILLNLKQIVLKGSIKESTLSRLVYHGPGLITAKDIELQDEITVVAPNQYIASVNANKTIEMEFVIKSGEGYSISNARTQVPDGFLAIDAIYMPVKKVNFFIETSGNSNSLDLESLILEVYTNGSITPSEAVSSAAEILQNIFCSLRLTNLSLQSQPILEEELKKEKSSGVDNILIEELELSVRAFNCLKRANIHTLSDLLQYSQDDLLEFKNFGQKSANEVCINLKNKFGKTLV